MKVRIGDWIEERNERTTVSDQHPVLTCSQDGILLQSAYFKKQIASQDNTGYKVVHRGDFTYRAMSDTGRFYIHQMDCAELGIVSPAYPVFFLKEGSPILPEYLLLFFESEYFHSLVSSKSKGSTRLSLRFSKIEDLSLDVPDIDIQNKRIELMGSLALQISDLGRRMSAYDEAVKSLFNEMFGDPVLNDKRWPVYLLGDAVEKLTDGTHHSPVNLPSGDYMYITAKNIRPWGIDLSDITYVDSKTHEEIYSRCSPSLGDVLYIKDGATTGLAVINTIYEPFSMLSSVALIKPGPRIDGVFLSSFLNNEKFIDKAKESMAGAAITRLTLTKIANFTLILPPLKLQKEFARRVQRINKLRFNARQQKVLFTEYRSSYLQDFFKEVE